MKRIGISTVFTGYNYGSALQAFATCKIINDLGYDSELLALRGSLVKGRDVRIGKLFSLSFKILSHPSSIKKNMNTYHNNMTKPLHAGTMQKFDEFVEKYLRPQKCSMNELKHQAKSSEYLAFVCGSDQIWNSSTYYVDPFYYLRFAPMNKRVSFAPSFGRDYVPDYNWEKIKRYVTEIAFRSVRETSAVEIIRRMTGEEPAVLIDPTLVLSSDQWVDALNLSTVEQNEKDPYILAYFLDRPSDNAKEFISQLAKATGFKVIEIPYAFEDNNWYDEVVSLGPREFLRYLQNAAVVCTDSFHGTAFSLNFQVPFYTFDRNYGAAEKQSTRIVSLLHLVEMIDRLNPQTLNSSYQLDFSRSFVVIESTGMKAKEYLLNAFCQIEENMPK